MPAAVATTQAQTDAAKLRSIGSGSGVGLGASFGVGFDYQFGELVSVGLDLKIIRPLYATWIANFEEPYETLPAETPDAWIVTPTVRVTVHLFSPGE